MTRFTHLRQIRKRRYGVILADPPSRFRTRSHKGTAKSPDRHYRTMTVEEIMALPIGELAARDCALFLWWTWPLIFKAERIIEAWGFTYSGLAWEWLKFNPKTGRYAFGGGYGTRKNCEPCLLARRGSPKILSRSERDHIIAPRREHSRKPDEQYGRIERMYEGPRLELFGRQERPGWDVFGNETEKFTSLAPRVSSKVAA
jgi:N6-adenosine-specific RNA methylase IME4